MTKRYTVRAIGDAVLPDGRQCEYTYSTPTGPDGGYDWMACNIETQHAYWMDGEDFIWLCDKHQDPELEPVNWGELQ